MCRFECASIWPPGPLTRRALISEIGVINLKKKKSCEKLKTIELARLRFVCDKCVQQLSQFRPEWTRFKLFVLAPF